MASSNRKISVIMIADAVGYSKHMEANEDATLASYKECEAILKDLLKKHDGSIFNTAGDSVLTEFTSAVNAVECGVEFQRAIKEKNSKQDNQVNIEFRVGINMGDVVETDGNLLGDGVNIAARLEALSMPGGVSISKSVHDMIVGKTELAFKNQGLQKVKQNEFYVYDVVIDPTQTRTLKTKAKTSKAFTIGSAVVVASIAAVLFIVNPFKEKSQLSDGPDTIVVIPFENLGGGEDQKIFALGLSQELTTGLSRGAKKLNIIGLGSQPSDLQKTGKDLGARFFISGSLRSSKDTFRVTVNLLHSNNLSTLWTNTYDKDKSAKNIFKIQDDIVSDVLDQLIGNGAILSSELALRTKTKGTDNLSAYECVTFTKVVFVGTLSKSAFDKSRDCLIKAVEEDPQYAEAWVYHGLINTWAHVFGFTKGERLLTDAISSFDKAIAIDPDNGFAYTARAEAFFHNDQLSEMHESAEKSVEISPTDVRVLGQTGYQKLWGGCDSNEIMDVKAEFGKYTEGKCQWQNAIKYLEKSYELDKANVFPGDNYGLWWVYWAQGDYKKALKVVSELQQKTWIWWHMLTGIAYHELKNEISAKESFLKVEEMLGTNNLSALFNLYTHWKVEEYWPLQEKIYASYNFRN